MLKIIKKVIVLNLCLVFLLSVTMACSKESKQGEENKENPTSEISVIDIDMKGTGGPDINYKRGVAGPGLNGFFDSSNMRNFLQYLQGKGMNIFNGVRNLYKDIPQTDEFYDSATKELRPKQISKFTDIRVYANKLNIEMISQVGGTPEYAGYRINDEYKSNGEDYAPLPDVRMINNENESPMTMFQNVFSEWAINADKAVSQLVDKDYHSIWIGTQEVAHTLGYPKIGSFNNAQKLYNIMRYIKYWEPIEKKLHNSGAKVGGIQLNSSNSNMYLQVVDSMYKYNLKLDYLTFQFYQWGVEKDVKLAFEALDRYNNLFGTNIKIIVDRGNYQKKVQDSLSIFNFFQGEKSLMDNANKVYAYTLDCAVNMSDINNSPDEWKTRFWMYKLGNKRRTLTNLPTGFDGFITSVDDNLFGVIWNNSNNSDTKSIKLQLHNSTLNYGAHLNVLHFNSNYDITNKPKELYDLTTKWDAEFHTIDGIKLKQNEYVLIELYK